MTRLKTVSAIAFLSAVIATPVFAQSSDPRGPGSRMEPYWYQTYDQWNGYGPPQTYYGPPLTKEEYWNLQNFGTTGRDPSHVGGQAPWLNPPS
jgi:hypothetical protein